MTAAMIAVVTAFVGIAVVAGAGAVVGRRLRPGVPVIAYGTALLAVGVAAALMLLTAGLGDTAMRAVATTVMLVALACCVVGARRGVDVRVFCVVGASGLGALVFAVGMLGRSLVDGPFAAAAARFLPWTLPEDNRIPALLASWLADDTRQEYLIGDWLPSDRPPMQSGLILLVRAVEWPLTAVFGVPSEQVDFAASVVSQALWVPGAIAMVVAIGMRLSVAVAASAFAAIVPVVFVNTVYTWPKLLAAAFVLAALAMLVDAVRSREQRPLPFALAAALFAFGVLSHGGAALMLPMVIVLACLALIRMTTWRRRLMAAATATAMATALYAPWLLFQRFVAPPGDRLLKWHFAGVIPIDDRSFLRALIDQYSAQSSAQLWEARLSNLAHAFDLRLFQGLDFWRAGALDRRLTAEFYQTPISLAWGIVPLLILLIAAVVGLIRRRCDAKTRWAAAVSVGAIACIAVWALAMFSPDSAIVHQGSHAWVVILLVVPVAWVADRAFWAAGAIAAVQLLSTILLMRTSSVHADAAVDVLVCVAGASLLIAAVAAARRFERTVNPETIRAR